MYQNLELYLDAAIDKVENLSLDVAIDKAEKLSLDVTNDKVENLSSDVRNQKFEECKSAADRGADKVVVEQANDWHDSYKDSMAIPLIGVAEGEHKYGAEAFEEFMARQGEKDAGEDKAKVDDVTVKRDEKSR